MILHLGSNQDRPGGERTVAYFEPGRRRGAVVLTSGANGARLYADVLALVNPGAPESTGATTRTSVRASRPLGAH